jgi:hypothetical protein
LQANLKSSRSFFKNAARNALVFTLAAFFVYSIASAQTIGRQTLQNCLTPAVPNLTPIGRLPETARLTLAVGLPLRNPEALSRLLHALYDPASPDYGHYLTPQQFTEQFGPTENDYQTAATFFKTNGLAVTGEYPNRLVFDVSGTVADVERVFHVAMRTYHHPTENRTFFSADSQPSLDLAVPIAHVSGLDNYSLVRPRLKKRIAVSRMAGAPRLTGSGPEGSYMGNDFRAAYLPGVSLTGAGQTLGLLEFDGYYSNDITAYETSAGLSGVTLTNVSVAGGVGTPGSGDAEVALDIEVAMSIAPGLSKIVIYEAPQTASFDDILEAMVGDTVDSPKQFSCSWGQTAAGAPDTTGESIFLQMQAQGQSFFNAAGDSDAFVGGVPFPSESTNIIQVGATTLTTTGPGGAWFQETTWNWGGTPGTTSSVGSSGGISGNFGIPYWQQGISTAANEASTTMHNVPDVAMTGDNVYVVVQDGTGAYGGTSCAAPAWGAIMALVNQQAVAAGRTPRGFITPALYTIGKSAAYTSAFHDIVTGNNFWASSTNKFPAVAGYDLCTGWGTPAGDTLIDALAGVSDALSVMPGTGFVAFGAPGGPFTSSSLTFSLANSGSNSLTWMAINTAPWLTVSPVAGTLNSGSPATNVLVSLNAAAYNLPPGTYTTGIIFSNQTTHAARTRQFTLYAGQSLIQNGSFDNFALFNWAQSGGVYSVGSRHHSTAYPVYNWEFEDSNGFYSGVLPYSGTYCEVNSCFNTVGYLSQNIPTVPGQKYLLSFWFTCLGNQATQQFLVNWNTNSATTNTVLNLLNPSPVPWTSTNLVLTATGTNTVLQFGGRNDFSWFGLQDVSVLPIPTPNIRTIAGAPNSGFSFSWNTLTNLEYQVQYSTNLASGTWLNLIPNVANGPTLSATNPADLGSAFFRVLLLP